MAAPPTRDLGTIDLRDVIGSQWVDTTEFVPDLAWPASVPMYARMRHDPKLSAILRSYSLPIRRATWAVDPRGCRDEVVQMVADDLGLPILGVDTEPGPARRRGVDFGEHLRLALLSLTFGFMPFERRYEIRDGKARLINLGERMPWSIGTIDLNKDGTLAAVRQEYGVTATIPANRLVWYAHDREGATWTGRSLLRAAYGPWLLKHELWRVHATSIRRFGMGVPSVTAPPGATPAQVQEAQRLASAMRAGDTAGAGLPNGYTFQLTGMTGSAPDALAYIQYLDQQMSTAALTGFLDLGQTATGSYALGESFIDQFLLSLQAVADEIAAAATSGQPGLKGAVTDLVDMNWGTEEPAPRVVCTDVGRRRDLAAEALKGLVDAGVITADPALEAYLRSAYRLPDRDPGTPFGGLAQAGLEGILTIDERRAQVGLPPLPNGEGNRLLEPAGAPPAEPTGTDTPTAPSPVSEGAGTAPAAARARPRRRRTRRDSIRAAGDDEAGHRQLTVLEAASGMDPDQLAEEHTTALDDLLAAWAAVQTAQVAALTDQIAAAIEDGDTAALAALTVDTGPAAEVLVPALIAMAQAGAEQVVAEAAAQGVELDVPELDEDELQQEAETIAALMGSATADAAGREAVRVRTPAASGDTIADLVRSHMEGLTDAWPREQLGGALWAAQARGRWAVLSGADDAQIVASEVLDRNTCEPCRDIDGTVFKSRTAAEAAYASGGYTGCLGRLRCRGVLIAVWGDS
ncbi:phage portal protein family protein [Actinomadura opuntiae]|uniref:phage portal protein family protein n=1 Tax=Actinomadura sp. OS1-43 TaxID=604315 RepID=UPI00255ABC59|nr:hypothetical protein [Actinomadura sp. OS1-43]MDL4812807.1 hypothetical protein [Actinomadura sp. OS1-43]